MTPTPTPEADPAPLARRRRRRRRSVVQAGEPLAPALGREVEDVPHRGQQVDPPLLNVIPHARVAAIEVPGPTLGVEHEDRYGRVLLPVLVFGAEVIVEGVVAAAEETDVV